MLFFKTFLKMYFLLLFSFYSECIRKRQITQLVIYFAVSYLATKHKSGGSQYATAEPAHYLEPTDHERSHGVISKTSHGETSKNRHFLVHFDIILMRHFDVTMITGFDVKMTSS